LLGGNPSARQTSNEVDRDAREAYTDHMPVSIEPDALLVQLNKLLAASGLSTTVARAELDKILEACTVPSISALPFIDPVTALQLPPPPPAEVYAKHWQRLPKRLTAEEFLHTYWRRYTIDHPHMLFISHLRDHDIDLENALRARAKVIGISYDDYFFQQGIITQTIILKNPPKEVRRQAEIFRNMTQLRRGMALQHKATLRGDLVQ